jgi:DNA mismatch repair protein MutS2
LSTTSNNSDSKPTADQPVQEAPEPSHRPRRRRPQRRSKQLSSELCASSLDVLGLPPLLEWVAEFAVSPRTKKALTTPDFLPDARAVQLELEIVTEALGLLDLENNPGLLALADAEEALKTLLEEPDWLVPKALGIMGSFLACAQGWSELRDRRLKESVRLQELLLDLENFDSEIRVLRRLISEDGELSDSASPELSRIRKSIVSAERRLRRELERVEQSWRSSGYLGETGLTWRDGRPVLPVTVGQFGRVQGMVVDQSQSGRTLFVEPMVSLEVRTQLTRLDVERRQEEARLCREATDMLRERLSAIKSARGILRRLDHLLARVRWARETKAQVPRLSSGMDVQIIAGRHPLLMRQQDVVPLDLRLGQATGRDTARVLLISGPNAGGKTVAMKTLGLFALMLRLGLPIPCDEGTRLPIFSTILTDIGDEQSIENDLSTYSSHILRMKAIVEAAGQSGLFLVDELGSGTDPEEGAAVAMSFLERMTQSPGLTVVSTHLGQLKVFAHERKEIQNASMSFDEQRIEPSFRLVQGVPGSSYALEILQRMELPQRLLDRARYYLGSEHRNLARLISDLQSRLSQAEKDRQVAEARRVELESLTDQYREKVKHARKEVRDIKREATVEAAQILKGANRLVENTVREIREEEAGKVVLREKRKELEVEQERLVKQVKKLALKVVKREVGEILVGDRVRLEDLETAATVVRLERGGRRLQVEAGVMKLSVDRKRVIEVLPKDAGRKKKREFSTVSVHVSDPGLRLDLRGFSAEEATAEVERYLDECLVSGLGFATILHGKGTGVLRQVVRDCLARNSRVESCRDGQPEEGGDGVTILKLDV